MRQNTCRSVSPLFQSTRCDSERFGLYLVPSAEPSRLEPPLIVHPGLAVVDQFCHAVIGGPERAFYTGNLVALVVFEEVLSPQTIGLLAALGYFHLMTVAKAHDDLLDGVIAFRVRHIASLPTILDASTCLAKRIQPHSIGYPCSHL